MTQPAPNPAPSPDRRPLGRRPEFWLVLVAGLLAVGVAIAVGMAVGAARSSDAAASASTRPSPVASSTVTPVAPVAEPEPAPAPAGPAIPADCAQIYTRDWAPDFSPLVLNPEWTQDPASGVRLGSRDEVATALLGSKAALTCAWGSPGGGSGRGLTTNVAPVTPEESARMLEHFAGAGYDCFEELGGTRCIVQTPASADGQSGESHFLREGIWVATLWVNAGPDGYTHDIVTAIFG